MAEFDFESVIRKQAEMIEELRIELGMMKARLPEPEPEPLAPGVYCEFPRNLYRHNGGKVGQVDHLGFDARLVKNEREQAEAIAEGWSLTMDAPVKAAAFERKK